MQLSLTHQRYNCTETAAVLGTVSKRRLLLLELILEEEQATAHLHFSSNLLRVKLLILEQLKVVAIPKEQWYAFGSKGWNRLDKQ